MISVVFIMHVLVCLGLILVVLLQAGKDISQTVFSGTRETNFLARLTTVVAILFMMTSLFLAMSSSSIGLS